MNNEIATTLFAILDGIASSDDAHEILGNQDLIVSYADAAGQSIDYAQAERIQSLGRAWLREQAEGNGEWSRIREDARAALEADTLTLADQVAALLDDDGQQWETADGRSFEELMVEYSAKKEYSTRRYTEGGEYVYEVGFGDQRQDSDDPIRYQFPDGSALVVAGCAWDHEGDEPFSWRG